MTDAPRGPGGPAEWPGPGAPAAGADSQGDPAAAPAGAAGPEAEEEEATGVRFRDNRRIDPETFQPRPKPEQPQPAPDLETGAAAEAPDPEAGERVAELTADLQRLSAEYANYRRRVDRDRDLQAELATAKVLTDLLPILDDIDRAREHGELDGGFKAVADAIAAVTQKYGLASLGAEGDLFDPTVHEAMTSDTSPDATEPTVTRVYQTGYKVKDRVVRAARVGVTDAE